MPFVQMENISHFLRACQNPPLSLPQHDIFLTVDLYENKDPAQVLQCLASFSRTLNALHPDKFPHTIGGVKSKASGLSPQVTGDSRTLSPAASTRPKSPVSPKVSSWSRKEDEQATAPAWNIHQYGYMGGASQGNQGVTFGARRQITSPQPSIPTLAEKERRRREEQERQRKEAEEAERRKQREREEEEERAKAEEERLWNEETRRLREKERREVEEEKKRWDEEQRRWEEEEKRRLQEEKEAEERNERERQRKPGLSDPRLNGQYLSQYKASQAQQSAESQRIKELERELELAKERERQYERERQALREREAALQNQQPTSPPSKPSRAPTSPKSATSPRRPLPDPTTKSPPQTRSPKPLTSPRRLPDPAAYASTNKPRENRTDRFLAENPAPEPPKPAVHRPEDYSSTAEIDAENSRRIASQQKTRAGGWASKTLLEREMERERERQREWEENQKQVQEAAKKGLKDNIGVGPGEGAWDVHQYGYLGGDNQNRGGPGLGVGGARRQIVGP